MTATSEETVTRRPIGAQLAVLGDRAVRAPGDAAERVLFEELPATWHGARQLVLDVRHWRRNERRFAEIAADKALAARQGMVPAKLSQERKEAEEEARRRWVVLVGYVAGAFVLVTVASVVGFWSWHSWRLFGPALMLVQLAVGRYYRQARRLSAVLMGTSWVWVPVFLALDITDWRWWPWWVAGGLLVVACEQRGMRMAQQMPDPRPSQQARDGVSFPKLWQSIADELELNHQVVAHTTGGRSIVAEGEEIGVAFPVIADKALVKAHIDALELLVGSPVGGVRWFADRTRAGAGVLHVRWGDPLDRAGTPAPALVRGENSVHLRQRIARGQLGGVLSLLLLRVSLIVLGGTGSGKTSLGWTLLDGIAESRDRQAWGIDLRRKNLIAPYRWLFGDRVAYTVEDAERLLDRFQAEIDRRVSRIAEKLEDEDGDEIPDENWIPSSEPGREQLELFVDELTSLTQHKVLREKLALIEETGRQAACVVRLFTPDLSSKKMGDASIFDQPPVKIVMATSQYDIKEMFGPGAAAAGWGLPATWERPGDAGKLLISSDEHLVPETYRADRFEVEDIVARRKWRREEEARRAAERAATAAEDPDVIDAEIVDEDDLRREAALRAAIEACGDREGLPVREVRGAIGEEAEALVRAAVQPGSVYLRSKGAPDRCFKRSALVSALREN